MLIWNARSICFCTQHTAWIWLNENYDYTLLLHCSSSNIIFLHLQLALVQVYWYPGNPRRRLHTLFRAVCVGVDATDAPAETNINHCRSQFRRWSQLSFIFMSVPSHLATSRAAVCSALRCQGILEHVTSALLQIVFYDIRYELNRPLNHPTAIYFAQFDDLQCCATNEYCIDGRAGDTLATLAVSLRKIEVKLGCPAALTDRPGLRLLSPPRRPSVPPRGRRGTAPISAWTN